jgi:hypothetical protein
MEDFMPHYVCSFPVSWDRATQYSGMAVKCWYSPVEMWRHTVTHRRGSEGETGEWSG